jgi:hypothetical protein
MQQQPPWGQQPPQQPQQPQQWAQPQAPQQPQQPQQWAQPQAPQQPQQPQQWAQPQAPAYPQHQAPAQAQGGSFASQIANATPSRQKIPYFEGDHLFVIDLLDAKEVKSQDGNDTYFATKWEVVESTAPGCVAGMQRSHSIKLNDKFGKGLGDAQALVRTIMECAYGKPAMMFSADEIGQFLAYLNGGGEAPRVRHTLQTKVNEKNTWTHHNYDAVAPDFVMGLVPQQAAPAQQAAPQGYQGPPPQQQAPQGYQGPPPQQQAPQGPQGYQPQQGAPAPQPMQGSQGITPPWLQGK